MILSISSHKEKNISCWIKVQYVTFLVCREFRYNFWEKERELDLSTAVKEGKRHTSNV